jgi:glucuronosyltransferase
MSLLDVFGYLHTYDSYMGILTPWAIAPHPLYVYFGDNMNFLQRLFNVHFSIYEIIARKFWYMCKMQKMAVKYFANVTGNC